MSAQVVGTSDISAPGSISDMTDMAITLTTYGTKALVLFSAPFLTTHTADDNCTVYIYIDGVQKRKSAIAMYSHVQNIAFHHLETGMTPGPHTIKIRWAGSNIQQVGATESERILTVIDMD